MKIIKIIIGFLLLFGAGKEYVNASRQLGSFFSPIIILTILLMLLFSTWLIGTGFSQRKFSFKSFESVKFFIISLVTFATVAVFSMAKYAVPDDFKAINGVRIPMNKCIDGSDRIIPDLEARKEYCICLAEKITNDSLLKVKYKNDLQKGRLGVILLELQRDEKSAAIDIESCFVQKEMEWTDKLANSMKASWTKEFEQMGFNKTNNVEVYCDCLINGYRKYPFSRMMSTDFHESRAAVLIEKNCLEKSKK